MFGLTASLVLAYYKALKGSFMLIHTGTTLIKIKGASKVAFLTSPFAALMYDCHVWFTDNAEYVNFTAFAIFADYVLGTIKHAFVDRDFSFKKNIQGFFLKVFLVLFVGVIFEGFSNIIHQESIIKTYLEIVARLIVFLYPAGSAMSNSSALTDGVFPPSGFMKRIKKFSENANPKEFTDNGTK